MIRWISLCLGRCNLRLRLILFVLVPLIGTGLVLGVSVLAHLEREGEARMQQDVELIARVLRDPLARALERNREGSVEQALQSALRIGRVYGVYLYDDAGRMLATTGSATPGSEVRSSISRIVRVGERVGEYNEMAGRAVYSYFVPLKNAREETIGLLQITRRERDFREYMSRLRRQAGMYLLLGTGLMTGIVFAGYHSAVGRSLRNLRSSMARIENGEHEHRAAGDGPREIGTLAGSLNRMVESLVRARREIEARRAAEEALSVAQRWHSDLILSDLRLPGADGMELLRQTRSLPVPPGVIILTAFGSIPEAVEALKAGADNFLTKPLDFEHMFIAIERALEVRRLRFEVRRFQSAQQSSINTILGDSKPMRLLFYQIRQIARAPGPVLITGESGVGKELVAHAIHEQSDRRDGPFVAVNCAGIPETLLESELFGHAAGSFTGANKARRGLFSEAGGGVLFLDEVTELPLSMQAKLLRVLQDHAIRPVSSNKEESVAVRVLAASNRDLAEEVREKRFRQDLYYRLESFVLKVPPLREREGDLELLAAKFLAGFSRELEKDVHSFSSGALALIRRHSFPGNVRELQNAIKRAVAFCHSPILQPDDLPETMKQSGFAEGTNVSAETGPLIDCAPVPTLDEVKTRYVNHVVQQTGGNKRRAASLLGIGRHTLYDYLKRQQSE